jgi:hypothetical protein
MDAVMASFSPTEAAFEGFRITRERPRAVVVWVIANLVFSFVLGLIATFTLGPKFAEILQVFRSPQTDPAVFWHAMAEVRPFLLVAAPVFLLFQAMMNCAIYRMILRPYDGGGGFLRLGGDELRVAGITLLYTVVWTFVLFLTTAAALFGGVFGNPAAALLGALLSAAAFFCSIFVLIRLSLAAPISFVEHRLTLARSWVLTRGHFWRLFGAYALAFVLGIVTWLLMWVLLFLVLSVLGQIGGFSIEQIGAAGPSPLIFVAVLLTQVGFALIATCYRLIMESPAAIICKALMQEDVAPFAGPT